MSDAIPSPDDRSLPRLGSYQVLRQLGSGGMSNVYQAVHVDSGSIIALKVLPKKLAQNAVLLQRFFREAQSAENLDHPNIVAIYDRGFDLNRHYLVLEYVEGSDMFDRIRVGGPMGSSEVVRYIREVALGLQYAAKRGMIHRDVKPANLLMAPDGTAKIIDLGLALMAEDEDERVTRDGTTVGTVDYMSPEQARDSRKLNERSDIYSLGCTLYYLVTGFPPYSGGNLADKLARHHSAEVPDPRDRNPEVPEDLALLIKKMMAKKPEHRFVDYQQLIANLDRIGKPPQSASAVSSPVLMDVLIDDADDEEDDDFLELTIATSEPDLVPPLPHPAANSGRSGSKPLRQADVVPSAEISLAELAELDADQPSSSSRRRGNKPATVPSPQSSAVVEALLEDAEVENDFESVRRSRDELPIQTWIAAGVGVGLLLAVVGFGVRFALSLLKTPDAVTNQQNHAITDGSSENGTESSSNSAESGTYAVAPKPIKSREAIKKPFELVGPVAPPVQPTGPARSLFEPRFDPQTQDRLGIATQRQPVAIESSGKVIVRRLAENGDSTQTSSLASAFGRPNDDVEIADLGPFHEDDCQIAGKSRIIRGRAGVRPIVKIEPTRQTLIRDQAAKFVLGLNGIEQLTLEGLDLVVDLRDLPPNQSTLFLCQGVDLTLRNCSITISNIEDRLNGFALFRLAEGPRSNRLRLERSLIRGPIKTLVQVVSGGTTIELDRTVVAGSVGPLFQFDSVDRFERSVQLLRCVLASRGPIFAWSNKPTPIRVRSLGTSFARVESPAPSAVFQARLTTATEVGAWLDYDGDANRWSGWAGLLQVGSELRASGSIRQELRQLWPSSDVISQESSLSWAASTIAESILALSYSEIIPEWFSTLQLVATPPPYLLQMTVDLFSRLPTPEQLDNLANQPPGDGTKPTQDLSFETQAGRDADFGLFLKEKVVDGSKRYLVRVQGTGASRMTPVRLPDGVSIAIVGPDGDGTSNPVPVFFAAEPGLALLELHGGDLSLANLGFASNNSIRTQFWVYLEDSLLTARRCRYRDVSPATTDSGGAAIAFIARRSEPLAARSGGFKTATDRATASFRDCWFWTNSDAIQADLARGVVELTNCAIVAGQAAARLKPAAGRLRDLEADLILENCTVVDDRFGVVLDASSTEPSGPGRPWLIVSRASVFPRIWREGGALVGVDPPSFEKGALFWQSSADLYEVSRFLSSRSPASSGTVGSADLKRHWVDLWGINHTRNDRGPDAHKIERNIFFLDKDRSRTSRPTPSQLQLDPKLDSSHGVNFKSLPPIPKL